MRKWFKKWCNLPRSVPTEICNKLMGDPQAILMKMIDLNLKKTNRKCHIIERKPIKVYGHTPNKLGATLRVMYSKKCRDCQVLLNQHHLNLHGVSQNIGKII